MIFSLIKDYLVDVINILGYPGVFFAMVIEACLIPLPSEITMPLAGALAAEGNMNIHLAAFVGAGGNVVGSLIAYWLGGRISEPVIIRFLQKWGRYILVSKHEYEKTKAWIKQYGPFVSFFSRFLPGIRTVVSLPAGVAKIPLGPFTLWTFAGSLLWSYILVYVGYVLGENWASIEPFFKKFEVAIIAVIVVAIGAFIVSRKVSQKKK